MRPAGEVQIGGSGAFNRTREQEIYDEGKAAGELAGRRAGFRAAARLARKWHGELPALGEQRGIPNEIALTDGYRNALSDIACELARRGRAR